MIPARTVGASLLKPVKLVINPIFLLRNTQCCVHQQHKPRNHSHKHKRSSEEENKKDGATLQADFEDKVMKEFAMLEKTFLGSQKESQTKETEQQQQPSADNHRRGYRRFNNNNSGNSYNNQSYKRNYNREAAKPTATTSGEATESSSNTGYKRYNNNNYTNRGNYRSNYGNRSFDFNNNNNNNNNTAENSNSSNSNNTSTFSQSSSSYRSFEKHGSSYSSFSYQRTNSFANRSSFNNYSESSTTSNPELSTLIEELEPIPAIEVPEGFNWPSVKHAVEYKPEDFENFESTMKLVGNTPSFRRHIEVAHFERVFAQFIAYLWSTTGNIYIKSIVDCVLANQGRVTDLAELMRPHMESYVEHRCQAEKTLLQESKQFASLTDIRKMYPAARRMRRRIIFHAGPTNSGKTYEALQRLKQSSTGVYCAPLRLLAQEAFYKLNSEGVLCNLVTGQEVKIMTGANHSALTVEMLNISTPYDVVVIDEIQMIADEQRGKAWTRALLGACAPEIHICGDPAAFDIVARLCGSVGETVEVSSYERMNELQISPGSLHADIRNIQDRDCVIAFSRYDIYNIKRLIESLTKKKCCVIYGNLPPETRKEQAELFNDPESGYSVLVASDAIGMGLNLNIKRIVFWKLSKFQSKSMKREMIEPMLLKQIAGRAGRRGFHDVGLVTTYLDGDFDVVKELLHAPTQTIQKAGIFPEYEQIEIFAQKFEPSTKYSHILEKLFKYAEVNPDYFLCDYEQCIYIARSIDHIELPLKVRYDFVNAPIPRDPEYTKWLVKFAEQFSTSTDVIPLEIPEFSKEDNFLKLKEIEFFHKVVDFYLWLSQRHPLRFETKLAVSAAAFLMQELSHALRQNTEENRNRHFRTFGSKLEEQMLHKAESARPEPSDAQFEDVLGALLK